MLNCKKKLLILIVCALGLTGSQSGPDEKSLKETYKGKFLVGVAINRSQIHQQKREENNMILSQFNSLTAENDMKWKNIHPEEETYNFEHADKMVEMAEANDMFAVGHTLVWHNQLAPWVFRKKDGGALGDAELTHRIKEHIHTVVGRYKGRIKGWDVVNEALAEDGSLRQSPFFTIGGEDYIEQSFRFAHEADPEAELYYNDYNIVNPAKRDGAIRLIKQLQDKGIKVDGIGIQGHWGLDYPSLEQIEEAIEMFAATGVKVMITELDISVLPRPMNVAGADVSARFQNTPALDPYTRGLPDSVQARLASRYADVFRLFSKHADKISRVTFWGLHDGVSWKNNFPVRGRTDYALLFDRKLQPKKAYHAVIQSVNP